MFEGQVLVIHAPDDAELHFQMPRRWLAPEPTSALCPCRDLVIGGSSPMSGCVFSAQVICQRKIHRGG